MVLRTRDVRRLSEQNPVLDASSTPYAGITAARDLSHRMALLSYDVTMERTKLYAIAELDMYCLVIGNEIEARQAYRMNIKIHLFATSDGDNNLRSWISHY